MPHHLTATLYRHAQVSPHLQTDVVVLDPGSPSIAGFATMILNIRWGRGNTNIFCFWLDILYDSEVVYTSIWGQMGASQLYFEDP
jgi:hypothetical protein